MLNTATKPYRVYHGANVRIEHRGDSFTGALVVQKLNKLTDGWVDYSKFDKISDYAYTESSQYASRLAAGY